MGIEGLPFLKFEEEKEVLQRNYIVIIPYLETFFVKTEVKSDFIYNSKFRLC